MATGLSEYAQEHDEEVEPSGNALPYTPPVQFKLIDTPPLIEEVSSDRTELWLVRISDSQLGPEDFKEKQVTIGLRSSDSKLGRFQNSKGTQYDIVDLDQLEGVQPFAFLPKLNAASLDARRISRQVAFVQSLDSEVLLNMPATRKGDWIHQRDDILLEGRPLSKKHQDLALQHMSRDERSTGNLSAGNKPRENQGTRSISTGMTSGGISTLDSLQEPEQRISTAHLVRSAQKNLREEQSISMNEMSRSPERSKQEESRRVPESDTGTSSGRKSHKHKRAKLGETNGRD